MPITYRYHADAAILEVEVTGVLTLDAILEHLARIAEDPRVTEEHSTLFDTRRVERMDLTGEDLRAIADFTVARAPKIVARKMAIVAERREDSGLARQYAAMAASFKENTIVFYNISVARKWLGMKREDLAAGAESGEEGE